ncbi:predicted protein [Nematostella vectensis]|uniref:G-protein coupled receptors family 1 profile domain-containing protein n=1 Tax=Nematostella vectensis TaxID=45351 RepID=A7RQ52_NEMVE|nr:QRFP-like peptide receptor [Nematostella vectensis]EDO46500.1 predicted protein [Nematostella vectensis]|eukprot:XP_001638563.1 predicted protein [Nematostella vectensis]
MENLTVRVLIQNVSNDLDFGRFKIGTIDIVFAVLYFLIDIIGVTGNALVILVVKRNRSMHTTTNFLLVNLAFADIFTLLTCPRNGYWLAVTASHPVGLAGDYICKFFTGNALVGITASVSSLTLTVLAVERYRALLKPMERKYSVSMENVKFVMTAIWGISILVNIPDFLKNKYSEHYGKCVCPFSLELVQPEFTHVLCTVLFLGVAPSLILSFCYIQIVSGLFLTKKICSEVTGNLNEIEAKKRLARLLISVTFAFYVCYISYGVYFSYLLFQDREKIIQKYNLHYIILKTVEFTLVCSSCINPILYGFQSSNYREGFKKLCFCHARRQGHVDNQFQMSTVVP